jgi:hypothetical protein
MVMDADTVKACLFAADDERANVRQGATDGNSERDADTRHLTPFVMWTHLKITTSPEQLNP